MQALVKAYGATQQIILQSDAYFSIVQHSDRFFQLEIQIINGGQGLF